MGQLVAPALRHGAAQAGGDDEVGEADHVHEPPAPGAEVRQRERPHAGADAEGVGEAEDAHGVGATARWHLLGRHDGDDEAEGERHRAGDRLERGEDREGRGQCTAGGEERCGHRGADQHAAATGAIGEREQHDAEGDAEAHDGPGDALRSLAGAELVGREGDGLAEQGAAVAGDQLRGGQKAEDVGGAGVEALRRRPPGLAAAVEALGRRPEERLAGRDAEQPPEPRDVEVVGDDLAHDGTAMIVELVEDLPLVRAEAALELDEPARFGHRFEHDVVPREVEVGPGAITRPA